MSKKLKVFLKRIVFVRILLLMAYTSKKQTYVFFQV